ncbi:hypothetical protein LTR85_010799 [Meristemomyces frigidus]|nr:hypothetical protein LTR85_010799 [Meristemomyces frigidus]
MDCPPPQSMYGAVARDASNNRQDGITAYVNEHGKAEGGTGLDSHCVTYMGTIIIGNQYAQHPPDQHTKKPHDDHFDLVKIVIMITHRHPRQDGVAVERMKKPVDSGCADGEETPGRHLYPSTKSRTFDVEYARPVVEKLRWSLGKANFDSSKRWEWQKIERAIVRAFERYDSAVRPLTCAKHVRKRKAEGAVEVKAMGKRAKGSKAR